VIFGNLRSLLLSISYPEKTYYGGGGGEKGYYQQGGQKKKMNKLKGIYGNTTKVT